MKKKLADGWPRCFPIPICCSSMNRLRESTPSPRASSATCMAGFVSRGSTVFLTSLHVLEIVERLWHARRHHRQGEAGRAGIAGSDSAGGVAGRASFCSGPGPSSNPHPGSTGLGGGRVVNWQHLLGLRLAALAADGQPVLPWRGPQRHPDHDRRRQPRSPRRGPAFHRLLRAWHLRDSAGRAAAPDVRLGRPGWSASLFCWMIGLLTDFSSGPNRCRCRSSCTCPSRSRGAFLINYLQFHVAVEPHLSSCRRWPGAAPRARRYQRMGRACRIAPAGGLSC